MKTILLMSLLVSLSANVVLLATASRAPRSMPGNATLDRRDPVATGASAAADAVGHGKVARSRGVDPQLWSRIDCNDLATLRDRLRVAGFPPAVVQALIAVRIEARMEARRAELLGDMSTEPFWRVPDLRTQVNRQQVERDLRREQRGMMREILGSAVLPNDARLFFSRQFSFLPADKAELAARIEMDYADMAADARDELGRGAPGAPARETMQLLEQEKRADILALLTPAEAEMFELHQSAAASATRSRLAYFDATEEEFRAVYELQRVFEERFGRQIGPRSAEESRARSEADRELQNRIKEVLGDTRYAEFERSRSGGYRAAVRIADYYDLPRENAAAVHALEAEYRGKMDAALQSSTDEADRAAKRATLIAEAGARIATLLGPEGAQIFRDTNGTWLKNMERTGSSRSVTPPSARGP